MADTRTEKGFTLLEMMVVVTIVGIMTMTAVWMIKTNEYNKSARSVAERVASVMDVARERAIASRRYQKLDITADRVVLSEATTTGMKTPTAYREIETHHMPQEVIINAFDPVPHTLENTSVPSAGANLPATLTFSPDGTADVGATVFINGGKQKARAMVYSASAMVVVYDRW